MNTHTENLRPVTDFENSRVNGEALCHKRLLEQHADDVQQLRQRQERYEASLPKDPTEAMRAICKAINDLTDEGGQSYAPRAALTILQELSMKGGIDDGPEMRGALLWLANEGLKGLKEIEDSTKLAQTIARGFHPMHEPFRA